MSFARAVVTITMRKPMDGIPIALLERGGLLFCEDPSLPPFEFTTEIKMGLGCTVITDVQCTSPGRWSVPAGQICKVGGYPRDVLAVSQGEAATGGADAFVVQGVEVLTEPERPMQVALVKKDPRYADTEKEDARTILRMNLDALDEILGAKALSLHAVVNRQRPAELAEVYANYARIGVVAHDGTPIMMGFRDTRLVYLATSPDKPLVNRLPSGASLFLASERKLLGAG